MSYTVWLEISTGGDFPARIEGDDWNYTANVAPMWKLAMPETNGLAGMRGMLAGEAAKVLCSGLVNMQQSPEDYQALNPSNGWGNFEDQFAMLSRLLTWFEDNPLATVVVSR